MRKGVCLTWLGGREVVWCWRTAGRADLSCSFCSKTLRLVWSRITLMLTKQPRSSFFERNMDILTCAWRGVSCAVLSFLCDWRWLYRQRWMEVTPRRVLSQRGDMYITRLGSIAHYDFFGDLYFFGRFTFL